ncbi:hypothetical protein [Capsulimonas corticalis]|nr:hypothetical protein [Capsulimonas corticalis]
MKLTNAMTAALLFGLYGAGATHAAAPAPKPAEPRITAGAYLQAHGDRDVAYDAKDKKFYSVAYAKAHGMRDKGGDALTVHRLSSLPKSAAMSRAMHGKM